MSGGEFLKMLAIAAFISVAMWLALSFGLIMLAGIADQWL